MIGFFRRAKERRQKAAKHYEASKKAQEEIRVAFEAMGFNFMQMHPVVHRVLSREALAFGVEPAIKYFNKVAEKVSHGDVNEDFSVLIATYEARNDRLDMMNLLPPR
jgi:hypothetical protein